MSSKKWLLSACGGALLASAFAVNNASASLLIDLQIGSVNGAPASDPKLLANPTAGTVLSVNIFATVRGANATSTNDGFQSLQGSFKSVVGGGSATGAIIGVLKPTGDDILDADGNPTGQKFFGASPFADNGTQDGKNQDLNPKDGGQDWGGEPTNDTGTGDFVAIRAASMQKTGGTVIPDGQGGGKAGRQFLIGSFDITVGQLVGGTTDVNFYPRLLTDGSKAQGTALWQEDTGSGAKDGVSGNLIVGAPIEITSPVVPVPEPTTVATLGLAAAGLLARRRRS